MKLKSVELFAGAGGLALGLAKAGFTPEVVIEREKNAWETLNLNQRRGLYDMEDWRLHLADVRQYDFSDLGEIDLIGGGPPCQPFSIGGRHTAWGDSRDMFPATVKVVHKLKPKAFIFENVKGLLRSSFSSYFEYILLQLTYPELVRQSEETWHDHLENLEKHHTSGRYKGLSYNVVFQLMNAADYGVPQRRERVFIVGFRRDLGIEWAFPQPTHSYEELLYEQWVTGEYWNQHRLATTLRPPPPRKLRKKITSLSNYRLFPSNQKRWQTVRDALADMPEPNSANAKSFQNHEFRAGARVYPGHTGSPFDEPAKTLKAGDHGVPGGENMLRYDNGRVRYFTVRESARLQTFPDEYWFSGSWTECMRQLGNAVPVRMAECLANSVYESLS